MTNVNLDPWDLVIRPTQELSMAVGQASILLGLALNGRQPERDRMPMLPVRLALLGRYGRYTDGAVTV